MSITAHNLPDRRRIGFVSLGCAKALVDEVNDNSAVARSSADAPEIDGRVFI